MPALGTSRRASGPPSTAPPAGGGARQPSRTKPLQHEKHGHLMPLHTLSSLFSGHCVRPPVAALLFAAALVPVSASANQTEQAYLETLPLVLSAARLPQPLHEVPGSVTVIDRELIEASGYRDLPRLFRLVAGMQAGQERGHYHWVTYHGLSHDFPTEMQVLIDGRSVISPSAFGSIDWSGLPVTLSEIERIEVVRGTNANSFGANAFLGVINIITRDSSKPAPSRASVRLGNLGIRDLEASWSAQSGPLSIRIDANDQWDDGFDKLNDDLRMQRLVVRTDLRLSATDTLMLRTGASHGRRGEGYADSVFDNNGLRTSRSDYGNLHLQWRRSLSADDEWQLSYYRNQERIRDRWSANAPDFGYFDVPLERDRRSVRDNLELQHRSSPHQNLQLVWGAEARRDHVDAPFLFYGGAPDAQHLYRLFGNATLRLPHAVLLNAGLVHEKYSTDHARLSPRIHLNWQASPKHTLRTGYARAWRQHNLFELYGDIRAIDPVSGDVLVRPFLPNPDLRQARIDTYELGYLGRFPSWNATLDVRVFNERLRHFIGRVPRPELSDDATLNPILEGARFENRSRDVNLLGVEYQLSARPYAGTEFRLAHTLIQRRSGEPVDQRTSPYTASLSWLQQYGRGWSSMLSVMRVGPLAGADGYVPRFNYVSRAYTTADLSVRYRGRLGNHPVDVALTALNLGSRHQEIPDRAQQSLHGSTPVNPVSRSVYLTFGLGFD